MQCVLDPTGEVREHRGREERQYACPACGIKVWSHFDPDQIYCECMERPERITLQDAIQQPGIGTEIHKRVKAMEIEAPEGCKCAGRIDFLNRLPPSDARRMRGRIARWLQESAERIEHPTIVQAKRVAGGAAAWRACVVLQIINPAIRAAEASAPSASPQSNPDLPGSVDPRQP